MGNLEDFFKKFKLIKSKIRYSKKIEKFLKKSWKMLNSDLPVIFRLIRPKIKFFLNNASIFLIKRYLILVNSFLRAWFKYQRKIKFSILLFLLIALIILIYRYNIKILLGYVKILNYVVSWQKKTEGEIFFSNFFTTIGASVLGVLAITFSLSLFALEQAANQFTFKLLTNFLKDKVNFYIFSTIGFISLSFLLFAIFPLHNLIVYELILTFIFLLVVLILLRKQYLHIARFINPLYQLALHHNEAIKLLNKIDKWLNLMIRIGAIQPGSTQQGRN